LAALRIGAEVTTIYEAAMILGTSVTAVLELLVTIENEWWEQGIETSVMVYGDPDEIDPDAMDELRERI